MQASGVRADRGPVTEPDNDKDIEHDIHLVGVHLEKLRFWDIRQSPVHQPAKFIRPVKRSLWI